MDREVQSNRGVLWMRVTASLESEIQAMVMVEGVSNLIYITNPFTLMPQLTPIEPITPLSNRLVRILGQNPGRFTLQGSLLRILYTV